MNHPTGDTSINDGAFFSKPSLVSIITVVYNGSKHLAQAIESVLAQTYGHIEYIVIDGGSNDGSVDIIRDYQSHLAYWISEKDRGISHAFNKGIGVATGDIVGILNADDWYEPAAVETAVLAFAPSIGVVSGGLQCWLGSKKDFIYLPDEQQLHREMTVNHPASFVRRSIYQQEGGYQEKYKLAMDYDVMLRFKLKGVKFHTADSVLTNQRLMGVSDRNWLATRSECLAIKNQLLGRRLSHYLYFWRSVGKLLVRKTILRLNGERWVAYYRERYSVVKKVKQ